MFVYHPNYCEARLAEFIEFRDARDIKGGRGNLDRTRFPKFKAATEKK